MTPLEIATLLAKADIATGKATKRSLGAIYAFAISTADDAGPGAWVSLNEAIVSGHLQGRSVGDSNRELFRHIDAVRRIGWEIHNAAVAMRATP